MRKIGLLLALSIFLSGCATYKFQKGPAPYDKGYVVCYDGKLIPEYTLGQEKSVPELTLAKERFKRRRVTVEYYYKKMGQIESRFKEFWGFPAMFVDFLGGLLRWPFIAVADYKYNHNFKYKEKVDRLDEQRDELEKSRISNLKEKLKVYIDGDLAKELPQKELPVTSTQAQSVEVKKNQPVEPEPEKQIAEVKVSAPPVAVVTPSEINPVAAKEEKKVLPVPPVKLEEPPVAVIITKPAKGPSPLQVNFNASKSYSKTSQIVSYAWDFGDGDTSTQKNPVNTYWSTTYGSRIFTATLTVKDAKGQVVSTSTNIEVIAK